MTKKIRRVSPQQWETVLPALSNLDQKSVAMARSYLVDGLGPTVIGEVYGNCTKQAVTAAVARVVKVIAPFVDTELVPVCVWLPRERAEQVIEEAKQYAPITASIK